MTEKRLQGIVVGRSCLARQQTVHPESVATGFGVIQRSRELQTCQLVGAGDSLTP